MAGDPRTTSWRCTVCGWVYSPAEGAPDWGAPASTPFEDLPYDWHCPDCGAKKDDFEPID